MTRLWRIWLSAALLLSLIAPGAYAQEATPPAAPEESDRARQLLARMSVEERVGQLFLVTFNGDQATLDTAVADLIVNYRIGGVILEAANENITGYGDPAQAPLQLAELSNGLQELALLSTTTVTEVNTLADEALQSIIPTPAPPLTAVPLFIAANYEGDSAPYTEIWNGLTDLPSNMAIGAAWQPEHARTAGQIAGQELAAVGVNMLLGPSLDVLTTPDNGLGARSFGGNPYWVSQMGRAYVTGIHQGGNGRVAVIAKHFPGFGSSDRPLHEEIPTVRKTLAQLIQVELAPFFAVTGDAPGADETADGLLATHIRYQGFQGNIRLTTSPVSLDPQALASLMELEPFASWRDNGGVIVSDRLGARAVQRFYDDTGETFPYRIVAKDAFSAGNDLLYLADFAGEGADPQAELANIKDTITWFQERYRTDVAFQELVDQAVLRILRLKLRLYGDDFSPENVLVDSSPAALETAVSQNEAAVFDIAQDAITLIAPSPEELAERLTRLPGPEDKIVIFTDTRQGQQCSRCPVQPVLGKTAVADRMIALYGPNASGQVTPGQIASYNFADLQAFLDAGPGPILLNTNPVTPTLPARVPTEEVNATPQPFPTATPPPEYLVQESLAGADWIILVMQDDRGAFSPAIHNFLAQRPDLARNKFIIVLALNAPYLLDSTEISQITAYYGAYSQIDTFIDAAVRALFQELPANGRPPVDVAGINYSLAEQTQPDPAQVIELSIVNQETGESPGDEPLNASVGDSMRLETGRIVDRNGNPVPDGTMVRFIQKDLVEGLVNIIGEAPTMNGAAQLDYLLQARTEGGRFRIAAAAGEAVISQEVDITVGSEESGEAQVMIVSPTPTPTNTPPPTKTPAPTETPAPTNTLPPTGTPLTPPPEPPEPGIRIDLSELLTLAAVFTALFLSAAAALFISRRRRASLDDQIGWPLWGVVGGLIFYIYYALGLPGAAALANFGPWAGFIIALLGSLAGLLLYLFRYRPFGREGARGPH